MKRLFYLIIIALTCCYAIVSYSAPLLRFGVIYFYPPFAFSTRSGYIHGFDVDVAKSICQKLNTQCSFTAMPLHELFNSLNQGKVDAIIGALSITPERLTAYDFTQPYFTSTMSFVSLLRVNIDINNLQGTRVGVEKASVFYQYITQKYGNQVKVVLFDTNEDMVAGLSEHKVDIILLDTPAANFWVNYSTGLFKTVGSPIILPSDKGYGIAVKKGNSMLLNSLNNALTAIIKDGSLSGLKKIYFKSS